MAYVILEDIIYTKQTVRPAAKKLKCLCKDVKAERNSFYDKEGVGNRLEAAKKVKEKLDAENAMRDENTRKCGEAAKAYALAKKQF